jgi:hypothetical protein
MWKNKVDMAHPLLIKAVLFSTIGLVSASQFYSKVETRK